MITKIYIHDTELDKKVNAICAKVTFPIPTKISIEKITTEKNRTGEGKR